MSSLSGVQRRSLASFVLSALGLGTGFVMHSLVALRLGPEGYGAFGLIMAALLVLSTVCPLGWLEALPKFLVEYRERGEEALLRGAAARAELVTLACTLTVSLALGLVAGLGDLAGSALTVALGVAALLPLYTLVRLQQQMLFALDRVALATAATNALIPGTVALALACLGSAALETVVALLLLGHLLAFSCQGVALLGALPSGAERRAEAQRWKAVTSSLVAGILSQRLLNQGDLLILGLFAGEASVGVYALARRLVDLVSFGNQSLVSTLAPRLGAALVGGRIAQARQLLAFGCKWSVLWALPWSLLGLVAPGAVLGAFGPSFAEGAWVLRLCVLGSFVNAATGPVGQALLMGGHEAFWRRSTALSTWLGLAAYLGGAALGAGLGLAAARTAYLTGLNLWRWGYMRKLLAAPAAA